MRKYSADMAAISYRHTGSHAPKSRSLQFDASAALPHNSGVGRAMLTVVETSAFARRAEKLLTEEEHDELLVYLSMYYEAGDEIPGTGGVRKLRYATGERGKSGGVRVVYYFYDEANPVLALFLYGKNEQENLTPDEKKRATSLAATMKAEAKARRVRR
jgi:hypothetical protein